MMKLLAHFLLMLTALIWGVSFVFQTTAMETLGPYGFTFWRFLAGALAILPLAIWEARKVSLAGLVRDKGRGKSRSLALPVLMLGVLMATGSLLQQISLGITSVANTAFLTTLYVPLVPLMGLVIFRDNISLYRWLAVLVFMAGSWLMSGASPEDAVFGDVLVVLGAFFWAGHIMLVGWCVRETAAPFQLAFAQSAITTMLCLMIMILTEPFSLAAMVPALPEILFTGVLSIGAGFTFQLLAQKRASNAAAAIILSLEGVFAALAGWMILGQAMASIAILGAFLILVAVLIIELTPVNTTAP
ncbi:DMT family transporter [Alphaproteobacteria bacterium LSUCC0684]